jgi:hypothetical protein
MASFGILKWIFGCVKRLGLGNSAYWGYPFIIVGFILQQRMMGWMIIGMDSAGSHIYIKRYPPYL